MDENNNHIGPRITDHMANERTFLAWVRTSLGLIAFGFVIERFILFSHEIQHWLQMMSTPALGVLHPAPLESKFSAFGIFLIVCGSFLGLFAFFKFMRLEKQITIGTYAPSYILEGSLAFLIFLSGLFLVLYLIYD